MEKKYVYVIYDPLYEKVICVHDEPEKECELCKPIQKERDNTYSLQEHKHLIQKIKRKNMPLFVRQIKVGELDKSKCSTKFLLHELNDDAIVNVKCHEDGTFDLRGKKEEYRIIVPDNY